MITTLIILFFIGYLAIALEHPIRIDKSATALLLGMLLWIVYALGAEYIVPNVEPEHLAAYLQSHPRLSDASPHMQALSYILDVKIVEALGDNPGRIWSEDAAVMNYLEWAEVPVTYDMRPEIWSEAIAGNGAANDYRLYVDSLEGGYGHLGKDCWAWAIVMDSHGKRLEKACPGAERTARGRGYTLYRL